MACNRVQSAVLVDVDEASGRGGAGRRWTDAGARLLSALDAAGGGYARRPLAGGGRLGDVAERRRGGSTSAAVVAIRPSLPDAGAGGLPDVALGRCAVRWRTGAWEAHAVAAAGCRSPSAARRATPPAGRTTNAVMARLWKGAPAWQAAETPSTQPSASDHAEAADTGGIADRAAARAASVRKTSRKLPAQPRAQPRRSALSAMPRPGERRPRLTLDRGRCPPAAELGITGDNAVRRPPCKRYISAIAQHQAARSPRPPGRAPGARG